MARILGITSPRTNEFMSGMVEASRRGYHHATSVVEVPGATRLAVLDRDAARLAATGDIAVVLDGALYNRPDLAAEIEEAPGAQLTDARLLASLYRKLGFEKMLERLNGDFALALYDCQAATLWIARDRLGVKPLYYARLADGFAFASRPGALIGLQDVGPQINRRFAAIFAASHYRYFDNAPHESPYERVSQLPAAHWLRVRDGQQVSSSRYWALNEREDFTDSEDELALRYRDLLIDAVRRRHAATDRAAFTLSGGLDSSSVLAAARHVTGQTQHAFSTVYSDRTFDESEEIQPMLQHAVSEWHAVRVDQPDALALVRRMIEVNDEPVATATWLSHFLLCEEASSAGFRALFGGLGGDELNAGEYEYFFFHFADLARSGRRRELDAEIAQWAAHHDHPIYRKSAAMAAATMERCTDPDTAGRCLPDVARMRRYYDALRPDFHALESFQPVMEAPFSSYLKTRSYQDLTRETAPCCLRAEDRQTQAFGLENHVPFFDHRLVEFMFRVPGTLKIREGVTKRLLRAAMRGILPEETRTRVKKTGWNAPAHLWFSGSGRSQLLDLLHSQTFRERGIYDVARVLEIVEEHERIVSGGEVRENHMMFLWQLMNLELWLQWLQTAASHR